MVATPTIRERIAEIIKPLQDEAVKLDAEIQKAEQHLESLRQDRRELAAVLRRAENRPAQKPGPKNSGVPGDPEKWVPLVRTWIAKNPDGEIVAAQLHREIQADAKKRNLTVRQYPGARSVKETIERMHAVGELRMVHKTRGGASVYKKTTTGG